MCKGIDYYSMKLLHLKYFIAHILISSQVVNGISEFNSSNQLEKVALVVCNKELQPLEKFILEINKPDMAQTQVKEKQL